MTVSLTRNQALTVPLLTTYGTALLLSRDGQEVKVPLAPLLAASHLVRSMVTETPHLHPGIHGPLILSFEVASDILVGAGEILATGESNLKEEDIEDVKQVLEMLRVEANLSYDLKNEYCENVTANIEYVKLEVVFESMSDGENFLSDGEAIEAREKSQSRKECFVKIENLAYPDHDHSYRKSKELAGKSIHKCNVCVYSARSAYNLKRHMMIHTGEKPYKCNICDFSCTTSKDLKVHNRIHSGEKPYKCTICDFSCSHGHRYRAHCRMHNGEKPYICKICGYANVYSSNLERHMLIHTGERPHKCMICDYAAKTSSDLKKHKLIHTGGRSHKCTICDYAATTRNKVREHERKEHGAFISGKT